jgi:hypothetical protein
MENNNVSRDENQDNDNSEINELGTFVRRYSIANKDPKVEQIANLMNEVLNIR